MQKITLKKSSESVAQKKANAQSATSNFIGNRKESILQTKRQEVVNNSHQVKQLKSIQDQADNTTNNPTYQLQKANGFYRMTKTANLRQDNVAHSVLRSLPAGTVAHVIDKGARVSEFKAGWLNNEHSWSEIPQLNQTGWIEDGKLENTTKHGKTPHEENQASRTEYHFGLNGPIPGAHAFGPRMDHINLIHAGTIAEYDWRHFGIPLPPHVNPVDHDRLPGTMETGENTDYDIIRGAAITHKHNLESNHAPPPLPVFANRSAKYTWYRKAKSSRKASASIRATSVDVEAGTDFSKSALIDMLVQGKKVHMHLTGMEARWRHGSPIMTGADFRTVLNKGQAYGSGKGDVTMAELRFIWRYWNKKLTMADDMNVERQYSFKGHTFFYYNNHLVPPPWTWRRGQTGADFT